MPDFFDTVPEPIPYEGPDSDQPLAFRWYDADRVVLGKTMNEHLRFGVCYWHSFAWDGSDIFGAGTLDRPWNPATASGAAAEPGADGGGADEDGGAFEFVEKLGAPFFSFHDVDMAPGGCDLRGVCPQPRRDGRSRGRTHGAHRHPAPVGHHERVLAPTVHVGCGHQPGPGDVPVRRRAGGSLPGRDPPVWVERTTCCGAAARATRRC